MSFSSNPLMAPVFQSPVGDGQDHRPPVVSIKRAEDAVESGIRLHHNQAREGFILQPEVEGLGVAPVELQTAPLASGGSVARHSRLTEGDVFLPITLVSPVPSALPSMFDALVDIARPGQRDEDGLPYQFEVVVFDPYGQETRSRRLIFESGLGDPVRVNHHIWRTSITGRFVDPFWYGTVRELRRTLGSVDKKFITANHGELTDTSPATYEWEGQPHASPSVKKRGGEVVARNNVPNPRPNSTNLWGNADGDSVHTFVTEDGHPSIEVSPGGTNQVSISPPNIEGIASGQWVAFGGFVKPVIRGQHMRVVIQHYTHSTGRVIKDTPVPDGKWSWVEATFQSTDGSPVRAKFWPFNDPENHFFMRNAIFAVGSSEQAALDQVAEYFDGSTPALYDGPGAYEFPFFPVRIGGSVVQGEYELQVEGDAPAYWSGVITPPGEDLLIQNAKGERIFVQGRVDEPILIQTRPQEQDITLADGTPIWDRIDPGDDDFFPLHPGRNTVHVSMVGATQQSEILIRYREAFFHALGGGR